MEIGDRIKHKREELNMSQEELAGKVGYKSRSSINKIECDGRGLPQSKIVAFAKALETTPAYLMGWEDNIDMSHENDPFYYDDETSEIAHDMYVHARVILDVYKSEDKDKLIEYATMLKMTRELKSNIINMHAQPEVSAAHERTDIEVTNEMRKHDDDIMNDDSEWN